MSDPGGRVAASYRLRRPGNGARPVGYAVVDPRRRIRYRTLDPAVADELDEVRRIVEAVR